MKSDLSCGMSEAEAMLDSQVLERTQMIVPLVGSIIPVVGACAVGGSVGGLVGGLLGGIFNGIMMPRISTRLKSGCKRKADARQRCQSLRKVNDSFPSVFAMFVKGESHIHDDANFLFLVSQATILFESALVALVTEPARPLASTLIACHVRRKPRFDTSGLEAWANEKAPAGLGITQMVLRGLRYGLAANREEICAFLSTNFLPTYVDALKSKRFIRALDTVRNDFRNPSCHMSRSEFSHAEYRTLCKALLGTDDFGAWSMGNPLDLQDASLLHNHLMLRR